MANSSETQPRPSFVLRTLERVGRNTETVAIEAGLWGMLLFESIYWLITGQYKNQPVRISSIFAQAMEVGVRAIPILGILAASIGMIMTLQGLYTARIFGAEAFVVPGVVLVTTREMAPMLTGILIAGRSGSALAARLASMTINQEIDALMTMGINPVRFLVAPALIAMIIMLPALTIFNDLIALTASGIYMVLDTGTSFSAFTRDALDALRIRDVWHGVGKSAIFGGLIAIIGVTNGISVSGGAEGVGRMTTRSVVQAISAILVTDMVLIYLATR